MGLFGWKVRGEYEELQGIADRYAYNADGDWSLFVRPDAQDEYLLENFNGHRNASGVLECEVEPPDRVAGENAEKESTGAKYFQPLVGKSVTLRGVWVSDCSHTWDNRTPVKPVCNDGRMEIHPIYSIFAELSMPGDARKRIEIFVFSDSSGITKPPHSGENIHEIFQVPFPASPPGNTTPKFQIVSEVDQARSKNYAVIDLSGAKMLEITIESGREQDTPMKGFYHAVAELWFEAVR